MRMPIARLDTLTTQIILVALALAVATFPLIFSQKLIHKLVDEERSKMHTWAQATECIASESPDQINALALQIIESNASIPLILTNTTGEIIGYKNLNDKKLESDSLYLHQRLMEYQKGYPPIKIDLGAGGVQYLYYGDSSHLRQLLRLPYILTGIFVLYILILVFTIRRLIHWEQDRIWVGLSKETAHQLGTPISSLMAWIELLQSYDLPEEIISHITQDVDRLGLIAHRFQKIGSQPELSLESLNDQIEAITLYLSKRISRQVEIHFEPSHTPLYVYISIDLMHWVIENIVKNAVDAMDGRGLITIITKQRGQQAYIDISDTGRGMSRSTQQKIFKPGFTTKQRGWGLGLSLVRRIVQEYFHGRIFVKHSELQVGTTFRLILPLVHSSSTSNPTPKAILRLDE